MQVKISAKKDTIVLYPEYYLVFLIFPWKMWLLALAAHPCIPKAKALASQFGLLFYISPCGEIILLGEKKDFIKWQGICLYRLKPYSLNKKRTAFFEFQCVLVISRAPKILSKRLSFRN